MLNLLPEQNKRELAHEYAIRLVALSLFFLATLGVIASTVLAPSLFLSSQKVKLTAEHEERLKKEIALRGKDNLTALLKKEEEKVAVLGEKEVSPYAHELIIAITKHAENGIKLTDISLKRSEGGSRPVSVTGKAPKRDALLVFARALEHDAHFSKVTVPVSNFAAAENIDFSILVESK